VRGQILAVACGLLVSGGPAWADFAAGEVAYNSGDYQTAMVEFLPLAEQGDASAQNIVGFMYSEGKGVAQDQAEAVRWLQLAAEQGIANAQCNLGQMYSDGMGVAKNDGEAVHWLRLAAEQGNRMA
jgi:TPR repeat protein